MNELENRLQDIEAEIRRDFPIINYDLSMSGLKDRIVHLEKVMRACQSKYLPLSEEFSLNEEGEMKVKVACETLLMDFSKKLGLSS